MPHFHQMDEKKNMQKMFFSYLPTQPKNTESRGTANKHFLRMAFEYRSFVKVEPIYLFIRHTCLNEYYVPGRQELYSKHTVNDSDTKY